MKPVLRVIHDVPGHWVGDGLPVRRSTNGNVDRLWLWNNNQLIADMDSTGTHRKIQYLYHVGTDEVYAIVTDSGGSPLIRYIQKDGLGSVTGIMRGNTLVQFTRYTAWGQVEAQPINTIADTNHLGWKGLMYEPDSTRLYFVGTFIGTIANNIAQLSGSINIMDNGCSSYTIQGSATSYHSMDIFLQQNGVWTYMLPTYHASNSFGLLHIFTPHNIWAVTQ